LRRMSRACLCLRHARALAVAGAFLLTPSLVHGQEGREAKPQDAYRDQIVAQVENVPITFHELELAARLTSEYRDLKGNQPNNGVAIRQSLQKVLETLIDERVLLIQCEKEKLKLTKDDEKRLEREVERQAEAYNGIEGLKASLTQIGVPYDYFVERKKTNI